LEDVRDADLGDVLTVENPAGWVPAGLGGARGVAAGAQGVAVTSVMAVRAAAWSAMACPAAQAAISEATQRLLAVRGRPRLVSWIRVIASSVIWGNEDQRRCSRRSRSHVRVRDGKVKSGIEERS
ncbi:MAG: hypothetical protein ACRDOE_21420, partial [Streptosporangiaceae bacterium]